MRTRILVLVVAALALSAGTALAKGDPPKDKDNPSHSDHGNNGKGGDKGGNDGTAGAGKSEEKAAEHAQKDAAKDASNAGKEQTKAEAAAARAAAKEAKFKRSATRGGYTCRGGTTHIVGVVVSVILPTLDVPGSITITVTKGNKGARSLVGTQMTIGVLAGTEVSRNGKTTLAGLAVGTVVHLDVRTCTPVDADSTDGIAPSAELLARKLSARK